MDNLRKTKGGGKGTDNVETSDGCDEGDLGALEAAARGGGHWRMLGSLEHQCHPCGGAKYFKMDLVEDDETMCPDDNMVKDFDYDSETVDVSINNPKNEENQEWEKYTRKKKAKKELNNVEGETETLTLTIDSGASENVMAESMAPQCQTKPSRGSKTGVKYVAANGNIMPNRGQKEVKVVTKEGHKCMLQMQVTDVRKALMSVSKICDAGHEVKFTKEGGEIKHIKTGQKTKFARVDDVYRLEVIMAKGGAATASVFPRREM